MLKIWGSQGHPGYASAPWRCIIQSNLQWSA